MKRSVLVSGVAAELKVEGENFDYRRADGLDVEGKFSLTQIAADTYQVQMGTQRYLVVLGPAGEVAINGRSLRIEVFDPRDRKGDGQARGSRGPLRIAASMPGKVVRVLVNAGDAVEAGQNLVVVEAMKMQNEMKAPHAGRVMEIRTKADATVAAGDILVVLEAGV